MGSISSGRTLHILDEATSVGASFFKEKICNDCPRLIIFPDADADRSQSRRSTKGCLQPLLSAPSIPHPLPASLLAAMYLSLSAKNMGCRLHRSSYTLKSLSLSNPALRTVLRAELGGYSVYTASEERCQTCVSLRAQMHRPLMPAAGWWLMMAGRSREKRLNDGYVAQVYENR